MESSINSLHPALGLDYGEARIGVAATDSCGILAHPVESIHLKHTEPLARIAQLIEQKGIRTLVVGLPLRQDGTEGSACTKVRRFAALLQEKFPELPLHLVDEYLTTTTAQQKLHQAGKKAKKFRPIIDQAAAVEILNNWMEQNGIPQIDADVNFFH